MTSNQFPTGTRLGNYELQSCIGEGGMGTVYAAVHVGLGKRVAIKTLRSELATESDVRVRFLREGKAAAAVRHPNVVDVDDVGIHEDTPYLVMELLEGEDLRALVERSSRLSVQRTVDIMIPVLFAMAEAHRAGVVHRDLKPDNIFLSNGYGGALVPKVLDFGISKLREVQSLHLTANNALLGTPYYMSPEQAGSARDVDARSDLYSIGVILYHCVTGQVPFAGTSLAQVIGQIMHAPPVPLRDFIPDVPAGFEQIVLRMMAKEPGARYQDAQQLAEALMPFASHRTQVTYTPELSPGHHDTLLTSAPGASTATPAAVPSATSTLSPSAHSVVTLQPSAAPRWPWLLLGAAALAAGLVLFIRPAAQSVSAPAVVPAPQPEPNAPLHISVPGEVGDPPGLGDVRQPLPTPPPSAAGIPDAGAQNVEVPGSRRPLHKVNKPRVKRAGVGNKPATPSATPTRSNPDDVWGDRK